MCKFTAEDAQNLNKMAKLGTFQSLEKVISLIKEAAMKNEEVIHLDVRLSADVAVALRNRGFKVFGDNVSWKVKEEPQLTWNSTDEEY